MERNLDELRRHRPATRELVSQRANPRNAAGGRVVVDNAFVVYSFSIPFFFFLFFLFYRGSTVLTPRARSARSDIWRSTIRDAR